MPKKLRKGIALALSGGGFRATLFHLGAILRLNELGLLRQLNRVVSVSGGSIAAGCLAQAWSSIDWEDDRATNLDAVVTAQLRSFCRRDLDAPAVLEGFITPGRTPVRMLRRAYEKHLFGDFPLRKLPWRPSFIFQSTNLGTGRAFRFGRDYVADYLIGSASSEGITLATAVAASSAFPPLLSPLTLRMKASGFRRLPGAHLYDRPGFRTELQLSDGGIYDNLALESAWDSEIVLVSDAGAPFEHSATPGAAWHRQAARALDIATAQARALRRRWLIDQYVRGVRRGAYWGITTRISDYRMNSVRISSRLQERLSTLRTRLNCFTDEEQEQLINLGYAMSDAACRSYMALADHPFVLPYPTRTLL